uniref:carboxylate-amine ligase n=1 Tax=Actinotalea sp. C106 TaxID=2908644 RepID=UPI002027DDC8
MRTVGVEEEYLLLDAGGTPVASSGAAIKAITPSPRPPDTAAPSTDGPEVEGELTQQQLESGTRPRTGLDEVLEEVRHARARAQRAAQGGGARIAALGTSPVAVEPTTSPHPRYEELVRRFALTAREQLTCGCHIHVGVESDEEGVQVIDRIGPWLPVLLALSSNSPFWHGADSGYASYRSQVWNRWPSAGPTAQFGSADAYHAAVEDLVATGTILDAGMVYFDARLSARYPTVEIRVADVCLDAEDAVLVAALARGLVDTAADDAAHGRPAPVVRVEQLR